MKLNSKCLSHREALESPCISCKTSPCCTHLPLHTFQLTNLSELDHAIYALNFDKIELGLSASGEWSIYYHYPCRFLDRQKRSCTIHNKPEQPQICVHYNPYNCWYKRALTDNASTDFIRIDRKRLDFIVSNITFDDDRNIVKVPNWEVMLKAFAEMPIDSRTFSSQPPDKDLVFDEWQRTVLKGGTIPIQEKTYSYDAFEDACTDCQAYCCKTLVFPHPVPANIAGLDYLKFCLGFPGIEVGIADDVWSIIVKTTCRHLKDNRCSVYDLPERPRLCSYYDAWKCTYKVQFGQPRPSGFLRIKYEQFDQLRDCFQFDMNGDVVQALSVEDIRDYVEEQWCQVNSGTIRSPIT